MTQPRITITRDTIGLEGITLTNAAREVSGALDLLHAGVLRSVKDLESQLAVVKADAGTSFSA